MEQMIMNLLEKSVVAGAFVYLLHYLLHTNRTSMEGIVQALERFGGQLENVSNTLLKIDMRMEQLERRVEDLEDK